MTEPDGRRTVLVTGSSRGVGRALAEHFLKNGDVVFGCSRTDIDAIQTEGYRHFCLDVSDEKAVQAMVSTIGSQTRRMDLVVNNAGISLSRLGLLTSSDAFSNIVRANLTGSFIVMREAIRLMKRARFGRIVNFSSINVPLASIGSAPYNASKAALENLTMSLARECGRDEITINCIGLSLVRASGMVEALDAKAVEAKQQSLIKPALLDVAEVMHAVEFFASPLAKSITGQTLYFGAP